MNRMAMSSVVVLLLGAAGCGGSESPPKTPEPPPASASTNASESGSTTGQGTTKQTKQEGSSLASSDMGTSGSPPSSAQSSGTPNDGRGTTSASTAGTTAGSSTASAPMTLTDDQILYVLHAANLAEMDQARVAEKKAKNPRVKRFASMMLKDHGEADAKGNEVAKKVRASLAPSEVSNRLESDAKQMTAGIATDTTKDFDRTYIDAQAKEHRAVLDAIDRELLPAAKTTEVKEILQTVRPKIEGHLREAEDIQKGLGSK